MNKETPALAFPPGPWRELYEAAQTVLAGLNARIDSAPPNAVPVFDGSVYLSDVIKKVERIIDG